MVDDEMVAKIARPRDVPSWARVLKTAPARAWEEEGKLETITRVETV